MNNTLPNVSATSPGQPFIDTLASGLLKKFATPNATALSELTIILPRETARVGLLDALTTQASGSALLLPQVYVFNDDLPSHNPREQTDIGRLLPSTKFPSATPIPIIHRRIFLAALIQKWRQSDHKSNVQSFKQSLKTASFVMEFMDELHSAKLGYSCMDNLHIAEHGSHWAGINKFLKILAEQWPIILDEKSWEDPFLYDLRISQNLVEFWNKTPPNNPIIAAGFVGTLPHVADLLAAVSGLTTGHVVIPNLDRDLQEKIWINLPEEHTQYGLKCLLDCLNVEYKNVPEWFDTDHSQFLPQRQEFLRTAIWPSHKNHRPEPYLELDEEALTGLMQITCRDASQESRVIALIIRKFLNKEDGNVTIITSDNQLLKKISTELRRWDLNIREPLRHNIRETRFGTFLQLVANMICLNVSPISLLATLKHPMCNGNKSSEIFSKIIKQLERRCLRGIRPEPGFDGIMRSLEVVSEEDKRLLQWLREINIASRRFFSLVSRHTVPLRDLLNAHLEFSTWLCQTEATDSLVATNSPIDPDDLATYETLINLSSSIDDSLVIDGKEYADIFDALTADILIVAQSFKHSRIQTCLPANSVFCSARLNILAGMNKDFWPTEFNTGTWTNTELRRSISLPRIERHNGISNFEFLQCFTGSQVVLTRSKKRNGRETQPADHFTRFKMALEKTKFYNAGDASSYWNDLARSLDYAPSKLTKIQRPAPTPPRSARPRSLSATQIEQWIHDPYSIFASSILHLRKLRPVDAQLEPADYGRMVHTALEDFVVCYPTVLPVNALQELLRFGRKAFMPAYSRPETFSFWWPRFERSAAYFIEEEKKNRRYHTSSQAEVRGSINISTPNGEFSLTAKVDRIALRRDEAIDIFDYKTGSTATARQILTGTKPQLLIEALIGLQGGYPKINIHRLSSLISLRLNGGSPVGEYHIVEKDIPLRATQFLTNLRELILAFDDEKTPYYFVPSNEFSSQYNDFQHLARMKEWLLGPGFSSPTP